MRKQIPFGNDRQVERVVGIDWSGRVDAAGQRRHIWAGVWTEGERVRLESGRTRVEIAEWLMELAKETPRMVVGFDFCFGFPAWFVSGEHGAASGPEFWELAEREGFVERWLGRESVDRRFWGKPHKRPEEFSGEKLHRMLRATDIDCKLAALIPEAERQARVRGIAPKSVFQIGGAGSVGTASLRGFGVLLKLRAAGFRVWPFDRPALGLKKPCPLVVEIYTRLNTGAVRKSSAEARTAYLAKKRSESTEYRELSRGVMEKAKGSEDAFDALVTTMVMAERRAEFVSLPKPREPLHGVEGWTWAPGV
ncbi:DUF429 domain-containing protein [Granulicella sp. 5B5]|uniref:DUF429 domain-containing protein n=1 Tax=Granulicella sp. 5B5 TaxID=1617967 RepID=UPI0015F43BE7|nr:DUF429 domain-containing protein [Granulicella sp. 5B5]QMV18076.1 DUF429 domain-containing protein [Granulicella sp. 5B5]